ncbi:DUF5050 domain-containing protein [Candidatus Woesearchaeota archaeon]|nr:DUF5050 domain-containing protein [Candidatus Woesearchaeota archaeon]
MANLTDKVINSRNFFSKIKRAIACTVIAAVGYFGIGCGDDDNGSNNNPPFEIPSTTKVLDDSTIQELLDYSEADGKLTFDQTTTQLESLLPEDVVVLGVNNITPNGLLRKVSNVSINSNVIVETAKATLEDAIKKCYVEVNKNLTLSDVKAMKSKKGISSNNKSLGFNIAINNVILYDADGDEITTTNDQIRANGNISFDSSFDFNLRLDNFELKELNFTNTTIETAQIELTTQSSILSITKKIEIARYNFTPITAWIGHVPVVITPILGVNVGLDGDVSIGITTNVTQDATLTAGLSYNNSLWSPISNFSNNFQFNPPILSANAMAKAYTGPQLSLLLYGITGPYGEINGYGKLEADLNKSPSWRLLAGLEAKLGVKFEILSKTIADYNATVTDFKKVLTQSENILFVSNRDGNNEIYAMNVDGTGQTRITNNIARDYHPIWSPDLNKIIFMSERDGNAEIYTLNMIDNSIVRITNNPAYDNDPIFSPDGTKITFDSDRNGNNEIYRINSDATGLINLTNNPANDYEPAWSPDGNKIAFYSFRDGNAEIYKMNSDGSGLQNLTNNIAADYYPAFSPDGTKIVFQSDRDGNAEICKINIDGSNVIRLTNNSAEEYGPNWSPDGSKIVFISNRDGNWEIYTMNSNGTNQTRLTNNLFIDNCPSWSP